MPNQQRHRGHHPKDVQLFSAKWQPVLQEAVRDLSFLYTRGYAEKSSVKLVGNRYNLNVRQRLALQRMACSDQAQAARQAKHTHELSNQAVAIDGYNLLITIESALSNGILFHCRDGCYRDIASVHGTYRRVEETIPALQLIGETLKILGVSAAQWYLDAPVSNSGRLKVLMYEIATQHQFSWQIDLENNPDRVLVEQEKIVVSSDSWVLDNAKCWTNLAKEIIENRMEGRRVFGKES